MNMKKTLFTIAITRDEPHDGPGFRATTNGLNFHIDEIEACGDTVTEAIECLAVEIRNRAIEYAIEKHLEENSQ